jgi:UDPglucose 6-dehydrogenase
LARAAISPDELAEVTAGRCIVDGRYQLNPVVWRAAGWRYRASGIPDPLQSDQLT